MPSAYVEIYYHLVWAVKNRQPVITPEIEAVLYLYVRLKCREHGVFVYALNGIEDHIHLVMSLPPRLSLSAFVHDVKGASSHFINHREGQEPCLYWQDGYGALTFSTRALPRVVAYVENQKRHHHEGTLSPEMERYGGEPDPGAGSFPRSSAPK